MPHESVLDSLASTFNTLVPIEGEPDPDICHESDLLGRWWSPGLSVAPSEALGPFALAASATAVVLVYCGAIDAMVAILVHVESPEGEALLERSPMTLVAS